MPIAIVITSRLDNQFTCVNGLASEEVEQMRNVPGFRITQYDPFSSRVELSGYPWEVMHLLQVHLQYKVESEYRANPFYYQWTLIKQY